MKNTSKILALVLIVMTVLMSLTAITASAEAPEKLYLTPSANWKESNARFAAYFFGNGEKWVSMTDPDGDGVYEVAVPAGYPNVIFCRMNPSAAANNWNNKWNQTSDLTIPTSGANHYTVKEGTWDKGGGTWSTFGSTCTHANLGPAATCTTAQECLDCGDPVVSALGHTYNTAHLCTRCNEQATFTVAGTGAHLGTEWDTGNVANDMTFADGVYTKVYENVAAGTYKFKVARDHDWGTAYPDADKSFTVATAGSTVTITLTGTTVDVKVEEPHTHNFVEGKCECGEEDPNYVPPHVHAHEAVVTAPTCTAAGYTTYTCSCGDTYTGDEVAALGHSFEDGKCVCGLDLANLQLNLWMSDASLYAVDGHNIKYNGAGNTYACVGSADVVPYAAGMNTFTITITNNGTADARVRVDIQGTTQVGNHKILNTGAVGGDVWTDSDWGGSIVTVPAGQSVTLVITFDANTERGAVENLIVFVDAMRGDDAVYSSDVTISGMGFSNVAPHEHNFVEGKCECGEEDPNYVPPHEHNFVEGKCECGEVDPDYVAPEVPANDYLINFSTWPTFDKGTYADGDVVKYNDVYTFIYGKNSRVDSSSKTWDDFSGTLRFSLGGKTNSGVPTKNAIQITVDGAYTLKIWYVAGGDARYFSLVDAEGNILSETTKETVKNVQYYSELEIPAAGTYYLTIPADNNYIFQIELVKSQAPVDPPHEHNFVEGKCECGEEDPNYVPPHVNSLVVGDTNKIVIGDSAVDNGYGYLVETVLFTADEKAHYEFTGENLTILVYDLSMNNLCGLTGKVDLEAGTYIICIAANTTATKGEFNVVVTKSEIVVPDEPVHENKIVLGENNKIVVDGTFVNQNGNPIAWVPFVADEKAIYSFASETEGALVYIFNADYSLVGGALVSSAILEPGNYIICVGNGAIGDIYVTVTKSEVPTECEHNYVYMNCTLCGEANPYFIPNLLVAGENKVVCNEYHLVDTTGHGNPYQFTLLTLTEDGYYIFSSDKLIGVTIFTTEISDPDADFTAGTGASWSVYEAGKAYLKAGTYYIGFIYVDGEGEYTVNIEKHEHNFVEGKCECGEVDPDYVAPPVDEEPKEEPKDEPKDEPKAGFFDKIMAAIKAFFDKILAFFAKMGIKF